MTNNQLTDAQISNATLIRLIRWADEHKSHYVAAALRELQESRKTMLRATELLAGVVLTDKENLIETIGRIRVVISGDYSDE